MLKETPKIFAVSALKGLSVVGTDGRIGTVKDFLFLDDRWQVRWLVIDTGALLPGRKVLIHPSAVTDWDFEREEILTPLARQQVGDSPSFPENQKLSRDFENSLFSHYGWNPDWRPGFFASMTLAATGAADPTSESVDDPHLRSFDAIKGYRLRATDGEIGRVENFLIERVDWSIQYLIVVAGSWLTGKEVLLAPYAVTRIDWLNREILLNVSRDQVKNSPPWDPLQLIDKMYEQRLYSHYGWPGSPHP
jgi:hypothetical protein